MSISKKRVLRIYPLYWAALIATLFIYGGLHLYFYRPIDFDPGNILVNFLGFQSFTGSEYLTYWFIGAILLYYLLYPLLARASNNTRDIVLISLFITAIMSFVYAITRGIENRVSLYFMVFVVGIVASKTGVFEPGKLDKYVPALGVLLVLAFGIGNVFFNRGEYVVHTFSVVNAASALIFLAMQNVLMISFCLLSFWMVGRYLSPLWAKKMFLPQISYGSYAAYLFEPMCFASTYTIAQFIGLKGFLLNGSILLIGIPLILIVGYFAQKSENSLRRYFECGKFGGARGTSEA